MDSGNNSEKHVADEIFSSVENAPNKISMKDDEGKRISSSTELVTDIEKCPDKSVLPSWNKMTGKLTPKILKSKTARRKVPVVAKIQNDEEKETANKDTLAPETPQNPVDFEEQFVRRSDRKRKEIHKFDDEERNYMDELFSEEEDEYEAHFGDDYDDEDSDFEGGGKSKKRAKKSGGVSNCDTHSSKGTFKCWVCRKILKSSLFAKRHIIKKHKEGLCAIKLKTVEDRSVAEMVLFCPRQCRFSSSNIGPILDDRLKEKFLKP